MTAMHRLPERIRPSLFAFGTLADGYLPFVLPDGREETIGLTSVVMKVRSDVSSTQCCQPVLLQQLDIGAWVDTNCPVIHHSTDDNRGSHHDIYHAGGTGQDHTGPS